MRCGRAYAEDDARAVLTCARECIVHAQILGKDKHGCAKTGDGVQFRVVDFGACWGRILFTAHQLWGGELAAYIGIEAGSKVGACQKNEWVSKTQRRTQRRGIELKGLESELTFADLLADTAKRHPLFWLHDDKPTLGHVYDGGVFSKQTMREVADLATASIRAGGVMAVVTTLNDNDEFNFDMADRSFIVRIFQQRRWAHLKGHTFPIY